MSRTPCAACGSRRQTAKDRTGLIVCPAHRAKNRRQDLNEGENVGGLNRGRVRPPAPRCACSAILFSQESRRTGKCANCRASGFIDLDAPVGDG